MEDTNQKGLKKLKQFKVVVFLFFKNLTHPVLRNLEMPEVPVYSVKAHKEILNSIDGVGGLGIGDGAPEIVTGSRDGKSMNCKGQIKHNQT